MKLAGKVAIITGAGSGIGRATALLFAREGARVMIADVVDATAEETVQHVLASGGEATWMHVDVSNAADVDQMVRRAVTSYGRLDILVNNAALTLPARVTETTEDIWDRTIGVDLKGVMLGCKYAIPEMIKAGGGSIVNIGSMAGLVASPRQAPYCAAKGGVTLLTKQVAVDYARDKIRVNCVCPSEVDTPMQRRFIAESPDPEATRRRLLERIPLGRIASADEIAAAVLFLASDDSSYVTGVALPVDGGLTAL